MPYQAGQAWIAISPSLRGFHRKIQAELRKELAGVSADIPVVVHVDTAQAKREVDAFKVELLKLNTTDPTVDVQVDAAAATAKLAAVDRTAQGLDGKNVDINVHVDRRGSAGASMRYLSNQVNGLVLLGAAVAPAFVPAFGAATVAAAGFASAVTSAGVGFGGLIAVAIPAITAVSDAVKAQEQAEKSARIEQDQGTAATRNLAFAMGSLTASQKQLLTGWMGLRSAFQGWARSLEPSVIPVLVQGMGLIRQLLPKLTPIVTASATAFSGLLTQAGAALQAPFWKNFFGFLAREAGPQTTMFGQVLGNLAKGFAGLLMAFAPMARDIGGGLVSLTGRFAKWGTTLSTNNAFQGFVDYVREAWPQLRDTLSALVAAFGNIIHAMAPLRGPALAALEAIFSLIAAMPPGLLAAIASGLIGIGTAFRFVGVAMAVLSASPVILIAAAIAALAVWLVHTWKTSETFRNVVTAVFNAVWGAIKFVWNWIKQNWPLLLAILTGPIGLAVLTIVKSWDTIKAAAQAVWRRVVSAWNAIGATLKAVATAIRDNTISPLVKAFQWVWDKAVAVKNGIVSAFTTIRDTIGAVFGKVVDTVKKPIRWLIRFINENIIGKLNWVTKKFGFTIPKIALGFNQGGVIPGGGPNRDSVMAMMTPGEGVLTRGTTKALGGQPAVDALNSGQINLDVLRTKILGQTSNKRGAEALDYDLPSGGVDFGRVWDTLRGAADSGALPGWAQGLVGAGELAAGAVKKLLATALNVAVSAARKLPGPPIPTDLFRSWLGSAKDAILAWGSKQDNQLDRLVGSPGGVLSAGGWLTPLPKGSYTVGRGTREHGYPAQDLAAGMGTRVMSAQTGVVAAVKRLNTSYGHHVRVNHPGGMQTLYAHLSSISTAVGRTLGRGSTIGQVGSTGNSTGPHLHLEVLSGGRRQDPTRHFKFDSGYGVLPPGRSVVYNGTGAPEPLVDPRRAYMREPSMQVNTYGTPKALVSDVMFALRASARDDRLAMV